MNNIFDVHYMISAIPAIAKGIPISLAIALIAFIFGSIIGLGVALLRVYKVPVASKLAIVYVSFMRGTPLLVQIFLAYYGVPLVFRIFDATEYISDIPAIYFIYVSFSLNVGAYLSETIRSAIQSVPKGQMEAAYSIGMTTPQALRKIIFPQALVNALPNIGNQFIMLLKDTSLAFVASVPEIIGQAKIVAARTSQFFEVYIVAALMYWAICLVVERVVILLERRLTKHQQEHSS
ncbi:amino acid ABC transporter permease [Neisseria sp. Ec49-e6-T10]|uniref:amino acid ABC transporter permease n=1 Tax=Neisseria sp. Ec49-e6-T10 TaxID=3140744 RepID=UPI003EBE768D